MNKNILIALLVIVIGVLGYFQFKSKSDIKITPNGQTSTINNQNDSDHQPTKIELSTLTKTWKSYTNAQYGFAFDYPSSWKLSEDPSKKEVTISTNDIGDVNLENKDNTQYPSWSITFKATDKTYFTKQRISTKMGVITYNENSKALMSDDSCLKAAQLFGNNPSNVNNTSSIYSITYGGSLMSDPAYSNSAILTTSGEIIIVTSQQGTSLTSDLSDQLSKIATSFKLLNGNTLFVPACAK